MTTTEISLPLSTEERDYLLNHLESVLGDTRVEVRHTRTSAYRAKVLHEEELLRGLLDKLRGPA